MDRIEVSTVIYLPPEDVYAFLTDFPRYANYSEYLTEVRQRGDGTPGTRYALRFEWWKLSYTVRSEVTAVDPPDRIDWRVTKDVDARGHWRVEELAELPDDAPADAEAGSRIVFEVEYASDSVESDALDLPRLVSLDWVIGKVKPLVVEEAERVVERIVADLEGRRRPVEIDIRERPDEV